MGTSICHSVISPMINFFVVCCFVNPGSDPSSDPGSDPGFILSLSHAFPMIVNILQRTKCKSLPRNALYERRCSEN